jgi:hypothetical protein
VVLTAVVATAFVKDFGPSKLEAINRWVGVVVAFFATVLVAPGAAAHLVHEAYDIASRSLARARTWLSRLIPCLRTKRQGTVVALTATASIGLVTGQASARVWSPSESAEVRIEMLRALVSEVEGKLRSVSRQVSQLADQQRTALADVEHKLRNELAQLRRVTVRKEAEATRINARALPVIGVGIFLSGVPEDLAKWPLPYAWIPSVLATFFLIMAFIETLFEWRERDSA